MAAYLLLPLVIVLRLMLVYVLVRKYLQTRDKGFVWLGIAVVVWPFVSGFLGYGERSLMMHLSAPEANGSFAATLFGAHGLTASALYTFISSLQQVIAVTLLLIAALHFYRTKPVGVVESKA